LISLELPESEQPTIHLDLGVIKPLPNISLSGKVYAVVQISFEIDEAGNVSYRKIRKIFYSEIPSNIWLFSPGQSGSPIFIRRILLVTGAL
jgi:hypothetical protein